MKCFETSGESASLPQCRHFERRAQIAALLLLFFLSAIGLRAQGSLEYVVLQTGGGEPLLTGQQVLQLEGVLSPAVVIDFGFFSHEVPAPGAFFDSFTVTLQYLATVTALLVTMDASGVLWAPPSQGAVVLADSDIQRTGIPPPSLQPVMGQGVAYSASLLLPPEFNGTEVTVYFDLFDNLDEVMSLGWYYNPRIISVPEPQSACLVTLGLLFAALWRKGNA